MVGCMAGKTSLLGVLAVLLLPAVAYAAVECDFNDLKPSSAPAYETPGERVARLEQELQDRLSQFEQCVQSNQSAASASSSSAGAGSQASSSLAGSEPVQIPLPTNSAEGESTAEGEGSDEESATAEGLASAETTGTGEAQPSREGADFGGPSIPSDIPPGTDDNILAAQLREAAQASGSEALWNEYRRYKGLPLK